MNAEFKLNGKIIETERLILRPFDWSDLDDFYEYASVDGVGEMAGWKHHENKEKSLEIIDISKATDEDFYTEYNDYIMSVKVVSDVYEAVEHINRHSTHHSEAIVTENDDAKEIFVSGVDSAAVYVNASTRFTDGGEFGLGCEMGISTQKLHARGPMGLEALTTVKYLVLGNGQIR